MTVQLGQVGGLGVVGAEPVDETPESFPRQPESLRPVEFRLEADGQVALDHFADLWRARLGQQPVLPSHDHLGARAGFLGDLTDVVEQDVERVQEGQLGPDEP